MANKKVSQLVSKPSVLVTDLFPIADPTTGQLYKTTISDLGTAIGSGVSSVNTLVGAVVLDTDDIQELASPTNRWFTDTRARAAVSASSPLAYNSGTGVFSIPAATSSQNGYLTSTDWTTFNAKQQALSGTGFVKISGTTISYDNSTYALDSAVVKLTGNQTIAGVKTFTTGIVADVTGPGDQGFNSTNTSTDAPSIFVQNNSTLAMGIIVNNSTTGDGILLSNDTSGRALYITNATLSGSGKGISIDNYNSGIGIEVGSDSTADAIKVLHLSGRAFNIQSSGGGYGVIINNTTASTSAPFTIQKQGANRITFTDAGAGTFVSTISAAGATLTGALSGTSATFSSFVDGLGLRANGSSGFGSSGVGVEIGWSGTLGYVQAYNRSTSAYQPIKVDGSTVSLQVSGTERLGIASTGAATFSSKIGVGGAVPNYSVTAYNSANGTTAAFGGTVYGVRIDNGGTFSSGRSTIYGVDSSFYGSYQPLSIEASSLALNAVTGGKVGIGTITPDTNVVATIYDGSGNGDVALFSSNGTKTDIWLKDANTSVGAVRLRSESNAMVMTAGGSERMRITSGGNLLVGTTTDAGYKAQFDGGSDYTMYINQSGGTGTSIALNIRHNATTGSIRLVNFVSGSTDVGSITTNGTITAYNVSSDYRLKEDLKTINGLDLVNKIKVYDYKYKSSGMRMDGVLAHELAEVLPYAVTGVKDGEQMQSVDYSKIVPVMVQAIKELKAELDTLKNK